jgi:hypothetical protein
MTDFKELELEINDLGEPVQQERLHAAFKSLNGVRLARITQNGVHVIYNARGITPEEIIRAVRQLGFTIDYMEKPR